MYEGCAVEGQILIKIREEFLEYSEGKRDLDELHKACAADPELAREWEEYQKIIQIEIEVSSANESLPDTFVHRVWGTILKHERRTWLEEALQWYRNRKRILIAVGGTCIAGLFCFIITGDMWKEVERMPVGGTGQSHHVVAGNTDVLVPLKDIKSGSELDPSYFGVESRSSQGILSSPIKDMKDITGKYAASDIKAGQPLFSENVAEKRPSTIVKFSVPAGYRVVTIPVDATSNVEGWARPGTQVDVAWVGKQDGEPVAKVVVEGASVVSFNQATAGNDGTNHEPQRVMSLLVTKDDALKLHLAHGSGRLVATLGTGIDHDTTAEKPSIGMGDVIKSSEDKGKCREARKRGIIDQIGNDGKVEKMVLDDKGNLVPLSKFCPSEGEKQITSHDNGSNTSIEGSERCRRARSMARKVVQADGRSEEMFPDDQGKLVPLSKVCSSKDITTKPKN